MQFVNTYRQFETFISAADGCNRLRAIGAMIIEAAQAGEMNEFQTKKLAAYLQTRMAMFA